MTPEGLSPFLNMEDPPRPSRTISSSKRGPRSDPKNQPRESAPGRSPHSRRTAQTRHRHRRDQRQSWQFRRSAASTIDMNAGRPENDSRGCSHFAGRSVSRESLSGGEHREDGRRTTDHCLALARRQDLLGHSIGSRRPHVPPAGFAIGTIRSIQNPRRRDRFCGPADPHPKPSRWLSSTCLQFPAGTFANKPLYALPNGQHDGVAPDTVLDQDQRHLGAWQHTCRYLYVHLVQAHKAGR
jgi:hypothetical protein